MKNLILVKLGGSLITNKSKPFSVRLNTIRRLGIEIYGLKKTVDADIIIGHGGGSFPHVPAKKYRTNEGIRNKHSTMGIAEVQDAAARLNRIVVSGFISAGLPAITFSPSSFLITKNGEVDKSFLKSLVKSLNLSMLPVVYGDVTLDSYKGCSIISTEKVLNYLALSLINEYKLIKIIFCGTTDGVYDDKQKTINSITSKNFSQIKQSISGSAGIDVTGGMLHKVEEALKVTKFGITTLIINGNKKGELKKAVSSKVIAATLIR